MAKHRGHGEGSLFQRKDGRWIGAVTLPDGRRRTVSARTRQEARRRWDLLKAEVAVGRNAPPGPPQTVAAYLNEWIRDVVSPNRTYSTWRSYECVCRVHLIPALGTVSLPSLTPQHVQSMLAAMARAGASLTVQRNVKVVLTIALNRALKWDLVTRNAASLADMPRKPQVQRRAIAPDLLPRFLETLHGERLEALYLFVLSAGLRSGELRGLQWRNVDMDDGTVVVSQQVQLQAGKQVFCDIKSAAGVRIVYLPRPTVAALRAHRARQNAERLRAGVLWHDMDLVFPREDGDVLREAAVGRKLRDLLAAAGLERVKLHDLRRSYSRYLIGQGVDPRTVSELMGHSSTAITMDLYNYSSEGQKRTAARAIEGLFGAS